MDFSKITNLNNYANALKMKNIWQNKKQNLNMTPNSQSRPVGTGSQPDEKLTAIINKLHAGKDLSADELEYLREHNPDLFRKAMKLKAEKKAYEEELRHCKTKEEVRTLHMGKATEALSEAKTGDAEMANAKMIVMTKVLSTFTATKEYRRLAENMAELKAAQDAEKPEPTEEKEERRPEETDEAKETKNRETERQNRTPKEKDVPASKPAVESEPLIEAKPAAAASIKNTGDSIKSAETKSTTPIPASAFGGYSAPPENTGRRSSKKVNVRA